MGILKKVTSLIIVFFIAHAIPVVSRAIASGFNLSEIQIEPIRQIIFIIVTYLAQIVFVILLLKISIRGNISKFGFNLKNKNLSVRILKRFIAIWTVLVVSFFVIALNFIHGFGSYVQSNCPPGFLNAIKNLIGSVLFAGIGEEPLFRSFVVLTLVKYWDGCFKIGKLSIPYVSLLSGFIFMTAHIGYNLYPTFTITYLDPLQLAFTFMLGVFWATVFVKTKSLLCPILAHSGANAIQYSVGYITCLFLK